MSGKTWSMLTVLGRRQYAGNSGYEDDPARIYRYDSGVGNSRNVSIGDMAVLRDQKGLIGIGIVTTIRSEEGEKQRFRCPVCRTAGIKERSSKFPQFRCTNRHEFDVPAREIVSVTQYEASDGDSFIPLPDTIDAIALRSMALHPNSQISIEQTDGRAFASSLTALRPNASGLLARFFQQWDNFVLQPRI